MSRLAITAGVLCLWTGTFFGYPSVFPTGTTIYKPGKTWSGYTLLDTPAQQGAVLIDMNGRAVKRWTDIAAVPGPFRILPGGDIVGGMTARRPHQEAVAFVQMDWNGAIVWKFERTELVEVAGQDSIWASRQHHDWQREGSSVGYYTPDGGLPLVKGGRTLILAHKNVTKPAITDKRLEDDYILEVSWDGQIVWEWQASDHADELGFNEAARNSIHRSVQWNENRKSADWLHINAMSYVGPNRWYDAGDQRFHPNNILWSSRTANIIAIIDRASGAIVWRMGPDYTESKPLAALGQIIGQHNPHIIPKGLPGAGNLLVFDNGGAAGYGAPNPGAPAGINVAGRFHSRVLEINPTTFEKTWEYSLTGPVNFMFFSHYVSSVQRLPNGNTLVSEGAIGRIFELTAEKEIVWEYVSPFFGEDQNVRTNRIYRAARVPYEWIPQLARPAERPVVPPDLGQFRIEPQ
jgi:hypothetical protein